MSTGTAVLARPGTGLTRSFTLVECLIVVLAILLVAGVAVAVLMQGSDQRKATRCVSQLQRIGLAYQNYLKDYDFWMPCGGNKGSEMYDRTLSGEQSYKPTYELPWFRPAYTETADFPYWYEALQPCLDPSATAAAATKSFNDRMDGMIPPGPHLSAAKPQPALRVEQARLMRLLACPANPDAPVGYGYHYTAPFGNSYCYPNNRDKFKWYRNAGDSATDSNGSWTPIDYNGLNVPIPILWFEQYVHSSAISSPSTQIAWVDTGQTNSATMALTDSRRWIETPTNNDFGYVRFPLMSGYWPPTSAVAQYGAQNYAWRPIGRHGGKASCLNFDGSARSLPILDICSPKVQWGDPDCLFDNKPPTKPPISPLRTYDVTQQGGNL
jgi:type II secretory pathway pseudopilin PulG